MTWLNNNLWQVLIFLGLGILVLEVLVFGLSTFVFFFVGLACLISGLLMVMDLIPATWGAVAGSVAFFTALTAVVLWKPMKQFQNKTDYSKATNDLVGQRLLLTTSTSPDQPGVQKYSGIEWKVIAAEPLPAGTQVEVTDTSVGKLTVRPV